MLHLKPCHASPLLSLASLLFPVTLLHRCCAAAMTVSLYCSISSPCLAEHVVRGAAPVFQRALRALYAPFAATRSSISSPSGSVTGSGAGSLRGTPVGGGSRSATPRVLCSSSSKGISNANRSVTPTRSADAAVSPAAAAAMHKPAASPTRSPFGSLSMTAANEDADATRSRLSVGMFRPAGAEKSRSTTSATSFGAVTASPAAAAAALAFSKPMDAAGMDATSTSLLHHHVSAAVADGFIDADAVGVTDENAVLFAAVARSPHVTTRTKGSSSASGSGNGSGSSDCLAQLCPSTPAPHKSDDSDVHVHAHAVRKPSIAVITPPNAAAAAHAAGRGGSKPAAPVFDLEAILRAARAGAAAKPSRPAVGPAAAASSAAGPSCSAGGAPMSSAGPATAAGSEAAVNTSSASASLDTSGELGPGDAGPALVTYTRSVDPSTGETVIMALASPKAAVGARRSHALVARAHARTGIAPLASSGSAAAAAGGAGVGAGGVGVGVNASSVRQGPRHAPRRHLYAGQAGAAGGAGASGAGFNGAASASACLWGSGGGAGEVTPAPDAALAAAEAAFAAAQAKIRQLQAAADGSAAAAGTCSAGPAPVCGTAVPPVSMVHVTLADESSTASAAATATGAVIAQLNEKAVHTGNKAAPCSSLRRTGSATNVDAFSAASVAGDKLKLSLTKVDMADGEVASTAWSLPARVALAAAAVGAVGVGALWLLKRQGLLPEVVLQAASALPFASELLLEKTPGTASASAAVAVVAGGASGGASSAMSIRVLRGGRD